MKRRSIGVLLALSLAVSTLSSATATSMVIQVKPPGKPVNAGETFEVAVEITGNPTLYSAEYTLAYDPDEMTCTQIRLGEVLEGTMSATNPHAPDGAIIAMATATGAERDGTLATYLFRAEKDLESYSFRIEEARFADLEGQLFDFDLIGAEQAETPTPTPSPSPTATPAPTPTPTPTHSSSGGGHPGGGGETSATVKPTSTPKPAETATPSPSETAAPAETPAPSPTQEATESLPSFSDIAGHWGAESIQQAAKLGLFHGYPDGRFGPDDQVTRAQFVTVLYRMSGSPGTEGEAPFHDLGPQSQEFRNAIAWSYEKGYVNGRGDGSFDPEGSLTREAAMKILFYYSGRAAGMERMLTNVYEDAFADSGEISGWAKEAMYWGYYNKLITGTSLDPPLLSPQGTATRAQLAKILVNYLSEEG